MLIVNMTAHSVEIICPTGARIAVPPSGVVARCALKHCRRTPLHVSGQTVSTVWFERGRIEGLPPARKGKVYFVSRLVAEAAWEKGRTDVVCPGTPLHDRGGRTVAVTNLAVASDYE